jgi:hypothetical protein
LNAQIYKRIFKHIRNQDRLIAISKAHEVSQEEKSLVAEAAGQTIHKLGSELLGRKAAHRPQGCSAALLGKWQDGRDAPSPALSFWQRSLASTTDCI